MVNHFLFAVFAQAEAGSSLMQHLVAAVVFSVVGLVVFVVSLIVIEKITPFSILKEIGEEHNVAVGVIIGAIVLGVSIVIAAAIQG